MATKSDRLARLRNSDGKINALAIDQRGSLKKMLTKAMGKEAADSDVVMFKNTVVELLTPYASGVLLDPEYGLPALEKKNANCGVLLAYEKSGYDVSTKGRLPDLLPDWTVARLRDAGADAIKLLVYYDSFDTEEVNKIKKDFIREVGKECAAEEMPFFLEVIGYSDEQGDEKGLAYAKQKPRYVKGYMEEFSKGEYGVSVLKVEFPVNFQYLRIKNEELRMKDESDESAFPKGASQFMAAPPKGTSQFMAAYTYDEAMQILREAVTWTRLPFIYLSAGVTFDVFVDSLEMANEAGVKFDGVLCGRATWQEGVEAYGKGGKEGLIKWLGVTGVDRLCQLQGLLVSV